MWITVEKDFFEIQITQGYIRQLTWFFWSRGPNSPKSFGTGPTFSLNTFGAVRFRPRFEVIEVRGGVHVRAVGIELEDPKSGRIGGLTDPQKGHDSVSLAPMEVVLEQGPKQGPGIGFEYYVWTKLCQSRKVSAANMRANYPYSGGTLLGCEEP